MTAPDADRDLLEELARTVLEHSAPEELVIFEETSEEYFRDPDGVLNPARRDEALGFGLDLALLTPYVLAVAAPVVTFLLQTVAAAAKEEATPRVKELVRRLFNRAGDRSPGAAPDAGEKEPLALTGEQAREVREVALARAKDLGLPAEQARLLADSVVGGLVVAA
ncbi:MAG TPA: hypothetical protein VFG72_04780 [Marmoricola sp.]|nr:hypothetical protein [Marmoricola sp.]